MADQKKPNIVMIMADDVGTWNLSAYHRGMMGGSTPNIDRIASEGALFTDYYGQQSCTAGRAAFITGQTPFRTGPVEGRHARRQTGPAGFRPDDRRTAQAPWLRLGADRQEPPRRPQRIPAHGPRLRRVLRHPLPPQRHGRAVRPGVSRRAPSSTNASARATSWTPRPPTSTIRPSIRAGAGSASRPSPTAVRCRRTRAWTPAATDQHGGRRRRAGPALAGLHRPLRGGGHAVLPVAQLHPMPRLDPPGTKVAGQERVRPLRRRDDGAGLGGRADPRQARRARHRRRHHRAVHQRQRRRGLQLARRRQPPVPGREGQHLRGWIPRAHGGQVARRHRARHHRQRDHGARGLAADASRRSRRARRQGEAPDGPRSRRQDLQGPPRRLQLQALLHR